MKNLLTLVTLLSVCFCLSLCPLVAQSHLPPPCSGTPPPADQCAEACVYCSLSDFSGTTSGFGPSTPFLFCGSVENAQWFGFVAGGESVTITAFPSNCASGNGIQLALYSSCTEAPIACNPGALGSGNIPIVLTASLAKGYAYFLMIDGWAGDQCDFNLQITPADATVAQPISPSAEGIEGPDTGCPLETLEFQIGPLANAGAYIWVAPPSWQINSAPSPVMLAAPGGHKVSVTPTSLPGQVCVAPANSCYSGPTYCKTVTKTQSIEVEMPPVTVGCGTFPYELPWGSNADQPGRYCHTYANPAPNGCDTTLCIQVNEAPLETSLPVQFICENGFASVCGQMFAEEGSYSVTCTSVGSCDSIIHFAVQKATLVAEISDQANLACATLPVWLHSTASIGTKTWLNADGETVGFGDDFLAEVAGQYTLVVTHISGIACTASISVTVNEGDAPPEPTVTATTISCSQPVATLTGVIDSTGFEWFWQGPNGFVSNEAITTTDTVGIYTFRVIDVTTGCFSQTSVTVKEDLEQPQLKVADIQSDHSGLSIGAVSLEINYLGTYTVAWFQSGTLIGAGDSISGLAAGIYTAIVTGANGCTAAITVEVPYWQALNICSPTEYAPTPICSEACFVCDLNGLSGVNAFPPTAGGTVCGSILAQNTDWIGFVSMDTLITITVISTNCQTGNGLQLALFEDCSAPDATACNPGFFGGANTPLSLQYDQFKIGQTYFLMIDGWAGDICDYTVEVDPPNATVVPLPPSTLVSTIAGPSTACAYHSSTYQVINTPNAGVFIWDAPVGWLINGQNPPVQLSGATGSSVTVLAGGNAGNLCVRMLNDCGVDQQICQTITIQPSLPATILDTVTVCHENLPYTTSWGVAVSQSGTYQISYPTASTPCDSIVRQTVIVKQPIITHLPEQLICDGGEVNICGQTYTETGTYESICQSSQGCDSLVRFNILKSSPQLSIVEVTNDTLGQGVGKISITVSHPSPYTVDWFNNGILIGTGEAISGLTAGLYEAVVTSSEGCSASIVVEITDTQVGVSDINTSQHWTVFPNPADHVIYLSFRGNQMPEGQIRLLDASGRPVWEQVIQGQLKVDIPCGQIPSGVYALMILSQNTTEQHLIVVQR